MFRSFTQAYQGLSRNPFAAFDCRILPFLFTWLWLGYIFFRPPIEFLFTGLLAPQHQEILLLDAIAILEVLVLWGIDNYLLSLSELPYHAVSSHHLHGRHHRPLSIFEPGWQGELERTHAREAYHPIDLKILRESEFTDQAQTAICWNKIWMGFVLFKLR